MRGSRWALADELVKTALGACGKDAMAAAEWLRRQSLVAKKGYRPLIEENRGRAIGILEAMARGIL